MIEKHTVSKYPRGGQQSWSPHGDHRGQWWVVKMRKYASNPDVEADFEGWSHIDGFWLPTADLRQRLHETTVWDDVVHHSIFTNVNIAKPVAFEHSRAAILLKMSYAGSQLNNVDRTDHRKCFYLRSFGHHGGDGADGMQKGQHRSKSQTRRVKGEYLHKL